MRRHAAASLAVPDLDHPPVPVTVASVALGLLALLTYAPTLTFGFVWDDPISVQRWLPAIPGVLDAFFPPPNIPQFPTDYYRPLQLLSYRLDFIVGGGAPWAFHLTVVLLHALATVLVFRAALRLLRGEPAAWWAAVWAAALFAVHPIHSESVAWMAARPDVMVTCAGLAALLAYWRIDRGELQRSAVAAAFIFVGLLCKENAAALLIVVPLSVMILGTERSTPTLTGLSPFAVALAAYLSLRAAGSYAAVPDTSLPANLPAALIAATGTYLRLLVFPYPQNAYIADLPASVPVLAASALIIAAAMGLFVWAWKCGERALTFSLFWIAATLALSLGVIASPTTAPLAERYLYLPSVGFCWAFGIAVARGRRQRGWLQSAVLVGAVITITVACVATLLRNPVWTDNHSLWSDTAAKNPVDGLPLRSLAAATLEDGDPQAAEDLFLEALERRNTTRGKYIIYNNLGTIALGRNDEAAAERYYRQAGEFEPAPALLYNLALIRLKRGMDPSLGEAGRAAALSEAKDLFRRALAASPHEADIHVGLAQTAEALGDKTTARRHFEQALELGLPASTAAAVRQRLKAMK